MSSPQTVSTIGHSTHPIEDLLGLLSAAATEVVVDVRSSPYSAWQPQFSQGPLELSLRESGLKYVFLGLELGGRGPDNTVFRPDGRVSYEAIAHTELFEKGLVRVVDGSRKFRVALLCAEGDPLGCHRALLVARHLQGRGVNVEHILPTGETESHYALETRLLAAVGLDKPELFRPAEVVLDEAYLLQEEKIAYRKGKDEAGR
jgi:uncharacterized protein (DUF488 family)